MPSRRDDLTQLHRLIDVVAACLARLSDLGADTTYASQVLAKLRQEHTARCVSLGEVAEPTPRFFEPPVYSAPTPLAAVS